MAGNFKIVVNNTKEYKKIKKCKIIYDFKKYLKSRSKYGKY